MNTLEPRTSCGRLSEVVKLIACLVVLAAAQRAHAQSTASGDGPATADPPPAAFEEQVDVTDEQVEQALTRGREWLRVTQRNEGRWLDPLLDDRYPNAASALAIWTLRTIGTPLHEARIREVAEIFRDRDRTRTNLARAFTLLMWSALEDERYQRELDEDVRFLIREQLETGGWSDSVFREEPEGVPPADPVTSLLALTALSTAEARGGDVNRRTWQREEGLWLDWASSEGGWSSTSPAGEGSREADGLGTAAALSCLYDVFDQRHLDAALPFNGRFKAKCGEPNAKAKPVIDAIEAGWAWLHQHPAALPIQPENDEDLGQAPLARETLYWFALARAADSGGITEIAGRPWPHVVAERLLSMQLADGSWGGTFDTCFALHALHLTQSHVLINKLAYEPGATWHRDPRSAALLTRWLDSTSGEAGRRTWQQVDWDTPRDLLFAAPILSISGHEFPALDETRAKKLRDYVHDGGTIVAVACCKSEKFIRGAKEKFTELFPQFSSGAAPIEHDVWSAARSLEPEEDVLVWSDGCRSNVFLLTNAACCAWQQALAQEHERLFGLAESIVTYVSFDRPMPGRVGDSAMNGSDTNAADVKNPTLSIARVIHDGDWWTDPTSLHHLAERARATLGINLKILDPVPPEKARLSGADLLWITGHKFEPFRAEGRVELKAFMAAGGTVIASACCGRRAFDDTFQTFAVTLYDPASWVRIVHTDALVTGSFDPTRAGPMDKLNWRRRFNAPPPARLDRPTLHGIQNDGRWALVYSPYDIHCVQTRHNCLDCVGYTPEAAQQMLRNMLLYVLVQRDGLPVEEESDESESSTP